MKKKQTPRDPTRNGSRFLVPDPSLLSRFGSAFLGDERELRRRKRRVGWGRPSVCPIRRDGFRVEGETMGEKGGRDLWSEWEGGSVEELGPVGMEDRFDPLFLLFLSLPGVGWGYVATSRVLVLGSGWDRGFRIRLDWDASTVPSFPSRVVDWDRAGETSVARGKGGREREKRWDRVSSADGTSGSKPSP